jgi:LacI family transcriptional regulator
VIAGSCHAGVDLPFRDLDYRAACRHAAGVLLALGHRRLALIAPKTRLAGDIESATGFLEGVRGSRHADATASVCHHDATVTGVAHLLKRITALLVANAYHCLAVVSGLAKLGVRVPAEVSVISRDEGSFLTFLMPTPARYIANPRAFARSLLQPVLELLEGGGVTQRAQRLMPGFVRGETIGPLA